MDILSILGYVTTSYNSDLSYFLSNISSDFISLASSIFVIIGTWKILEKAGEQGWKSLIPFYNNYTLYKIFWKVKWFWVSLIPSFVAVLSFVILVLDIVAAVVVSGSNEYTGGFAASFIIPIIIFALLLIVSGAFSIVIKVILSNRISKAFGKTAGFTVGLVLLPPVFYMILGFGKDKYKKIK